MVKRKYKRKLSKSELLIFFITGTIIYFIMGVILGSLPSSIISSRFINWIFIIIGLITTTMVSVGVLYLWNISLSNGKIHIVSAIAGNLFMIIITSILL